MKQMTLVELDRHERRWTRVLAVAAGLLVLALVDLVALRPQGMAGWMAMIAAGLGAAVCWYAGYRLKDEDRIPSLGGAGELAADNLPSDLGAGLGSGDE